MDTLADWLLQQSPLFLFGFGVAVVITAILVILGKLSTAGQVDRDRERDKETINRYREANDKLISSLAKSHQNDEKMLALLQTLVRRRGSTK